MTLYRVSRIGRNETGRKKSSNQQLGLDTYNRVNCTKGAQGSGSGVRPGDGISLWFLSYTKASSQFLVIKFFLQSFA